MKKIFNFLLITCLVCFSFFYTDKVIDLINKKDPLMVEIKSIKDKYSVKAVDAVIEDNTIIPGVNGREIDIDKSYEKMKLEGVFREESIIYTSISPSSSIIDNKDKYIIKGNSSKNEVSLLVIIDSNNDLEKIININNITLYIDSSYLNINNINKIKNKEIYSYGNNGIYTDEILISNNSLIKRKIGYNPMYCLSKEKNNNILEICSNNNMYTVIPNIVGDLLEVKRNLTSGSIILIENLENINQIIRYINSKGYDIVALNKLLEE